MKKLFLILAIGVSIVLNSSCKKKGCTNPDASNYCNECKDDNSQCVFIIRYEVTGSPGTFDVTIANTSGGTDQYANVSSGWYYEWKSTGCCWDDKFRYVSAQNNSNTGNVNVVIKVGNTIKYQGQCQGSYCIATANN